MQFLEDGPAFAQVAEEVFQFAGGKVFEFVRQIVFPDEVTQQCAVGTSVVFVKHDAVIVFAAEFGGMVNRMEPAPEAFIAVSTTGVDAPE